MGGSERGSWAWALLELLFLQLLMMNKIRATSSSVSRTPAKKAKIKCSFLGLEQEGAELVTGVAVETVLVLGLDVVEADPMLSSPFQKNSSQKMQLSKMKLASLFRRLFQKW